MANVLKFKRGNSTNLTSLTLEAGEPAFTLDTGKLYVGNGSEKVLINPDISTEAETAEKLKTARNISLGGDATGSIVFDGSEDKEISVTLKSVGTSGVQKPKVTTDAQGRIISSEDLTISDIPTLTVSNISDAGTAAKADTGTASGNVPVLGENGKLSAEVLPAIAITDTFVAADEAAMIALNAQVGDVAVRTDLNKSFILKTAGASIVANWQELLTPTDAVTTVNGQKGDVVITDVTGNAGTADKLKTARTVQVNLAATSSASFDGSENVTPGVTGILSVTNGGTGATTAEAARTALGCLGADDDIDGGTF